VLYYDVSVSEDSEKFCKLCKVYEVYGYTIDNWIYLTSGPRARSGLTIIGRRTVPECIKAS